MKALAPLLALLAACCGTALAVQQPASMDGVVHFLAPRGGPPPPPTAPAPAPTPWLHIAIGVAVVLVILAIVGAALAPRHGAAAGAAKGPPEDTSVVLCPRYQVTPGRMARVKGTLQGMHDSIHPEQESLLYFGFTIDEANGIVMSREAYKNADGALAHWQNVDPVFKAMLKDASLDSLEAHGPRDEIDKLRDALAPHGCKFFVRDSGSRLHSVKEPSTWALSVADRSLLLVLNFEIPPGSEGDFAAAMPKLYSAQPETEGMLYQGISLSEDGAMAVSRAAFVDADGLLAHYGNIDAALKAAMEVAPLAGAEVHGPFGEITKLVDALAPLSCRHFTADAGCTTWMQGVAFSLGDIDIVQVFKESGERLAEQLHTRVDKGSRTREVVEARAEAFTDKAKNFVIKSLNDAAKDLLQAIDSDEATTLIEFNNAVEASFPPLTVLLAGLVSPALLSMSLASHVVQLLALFLPVLIATTWAVYTDWGTTCDIPSLHLWIWVALVLSLIQVVCRAALAANISSGRNMLKQKTDEITMRILENAADGDTSIGDMQDLIIGGAVLVQESLLLEDRIRRSPLVDAVGACNLMWIVAVIWNAVVIIGWTFVPGTIAFYKSAGGVAHGEYCGSWASVLTGRIVVMTTPLFFVMNILAAVQWIVLKVVHSQAVSSKMLGAAEHLDRGAGGIPVVQTVVKAFLLRAQQDTKKARLTVALGEQLRLGKEREDTHLRIQELQRRIDSSKLERKVLKTLAKKRGDGMAANLQQLEQAGQEDTAAWKKIGEALAKEAEQRASSGQQVATEQLEKAAQHLSNISDQVQNTEAFKKAMEKAKAAIEEARAAAEQAQESATEAAQEAAKQAQQAAATGFEQAQQAAATGLEQAQQAAASAQEAAAAGLDQAQQAAASGLEEAQQSPAPASPSGDDTPSRRWFGRYGRQ